MHATTGFTREIEVHGNMIRTIIFRNDARGGAVHAIVCTSEQTYTQECRRLEQMDHITILDAGCARVH